MSGQLNSTNAGVTGTSLARRGVARYAMADGGRAMCPEPWQGNGMTGLNAADHLGPIEYIVVRFEGSKFSGAITDALGELLDQGLIRVIDLVVVSKDMGGNVAIIEAGELDPEVASAVERLTGGAGGLLSEADLLELAEELEPNSTAAAMLFEHVWATRFASAVRAANGTLVLSERIPHEVVAEARASLLATAG